MGPLTPTSNNGSSLANLGLAVNQNLNGVTGDKTSPFTRAGNTPNAMLGVGKQWADSVGQTRDAWKNINAPATPGGPPPTTGQKTARVIRAAQQTLGGIMGGLGLLKGALDVGFANLTAPLAAICPSLPAATVMSPYVGTPHAHIAHPPSGPPPLPPTPLPSIGMVLLGVSVRVLINSMPAARVDDIGLAPTCCGIPPAWFKIKTGSSNVFIGGVRAARLMDVCKACPMIPETPSISAGAVMGAIGKAASVAAKVMAVAGVAVGALGMAADVAEAAVEDSEAMASAKALSAAMSAAQMAMDAGKMAAEKIMWKDVPVVPPTGSIGAIVDPSHATVLIGGFPMINIPDPVSALLHRLSRYKATSPPANEGCGEEGEPVDVVTGANLEESTDVPLDEELSLAWRRYYSSAQCTVRGPLGWGWRHEFQCELRLDLEGLLYIPCFGPSVPFPHLTRDGGSATRDGFTLCRVNRSKYRLLRRGSASLEFEFEAEHWKGKLTRIFNPRAEARLVYDDQDRLTQLHTSRKRSVLLEYDRQGRLTCLSEVRGPGPRQGLVSYEYDDNEDLVAWIDAVGSRATLEYNTRHQLTRKGDRRSYSYFYAYDEAGRCVHTWGEDGMYDVRLTYLEGARCTQALHADGGVWSFFYDQNGTITRIVDPYGETRERHTDAHGRVVSEIDAGGNKYRIVYAVDGGIVGRQDPFGHVSRDLADLRRHNHLALEAPATPLGWAYGALLRPDRIQTASPGSQTICDLLGRKVEEKASDSGRRRWAYDGNGNVLRYQDGDGLIHRFEYASWNLLRRETDPLGNSTEYAYTARERITGVADAGGTASKYSYDLRDNIVRVSRHGKVREQYLRDATDNLIEKRDGEGRMILAFEIGPGNLKKVRRLGSGENHYFEHDSSARLTRAATDEHETLFKYGRGGKAVSDTRDGLGVKYLFDAPKRYRIVLLDRFEIHYSTTPDGALTIADPTGAVHRVKAQYDGTVAVELSSGTSEVSRFDVAGRCLSKVRTQRGRRAWGREFRYSPEGDLLAAIDTATGGSTYEYDAAHRLIGQSNPDGRNQRYSYDAAGNLLAKPGLSGVVLATGNRLASANGDAFTYNDRDHISAYGSGEKAVQFEYDSCDRLVRCLTPAGEWRSTYDPLGRRITKTWQGFTTEYYWDDNRLAAERAPDGGLRIYVYADDRALVPFLFVDYASSLAPRGSGKRYFVVTDQIGAPVQVEDSQGKTVWSARVDPYGETEVRAGNTIDFWLRFPGHQEDHEIGLFYNRFRHYSPLLGRYLQCDPMGIAGGKNLYAYPASPLTSVDLFGLHPPKSEDDEEASKTGKDEETPEEKMSRLKQERDDRIRERERQATLEAAIAKADASGKLDGLSAEDRAWLESDPRNKLLAIDPDGSGSYRIDEAKAALQAEKEGTLPAPVRRATEDAHPSEAGADFVDGDNNNWDHKDASHGADNIAKTANPPQGENVLVDSRNQTPEEQQALKDAVDPQLQNPGANRVAYVPKL